MGRRAIDHGESHDSRRRAAGRKTFGLSRRDQDRPDIDFADSPSIAFEVKAVPAKVEPKKPFPWWIAAVAVLAIAVVGGLVWFLLPRTSGPFRTV